MKRISINIFLIILIVLVPLASSIESDYFRYREIDYNQNNPFKIQLTNDSIYEINELISRINDDTLRNNVYLVINQIITNEGILLANRFFEIYSENGIIELYKNKETLDPLNELYDYILELIIERLGWLNDLFEITSEIIDDARDLWNDRTIPKDVRNEINNIINKMNELEYLLSLLAEGKYFRFFREWSPLVFINDTIAIVESLSQISNDLGILFGDIRDFINDVSDFISWLRGEPWKDQIYVYGRVMKDIINGASNVTISCINTTTQTDENGNFSMFISPSPSEVSFPPNSYYGIHKCVINAEKDDITKSSPDELSYVFSGGSIFWTFILSDDDSTSRKYENLFQNLFNDNSLIFSILMKFFNY
jgi:hypothetical protein